MREILPLIEEKKNALERSRFLQWLAGGDNPQEDRFAFLPAQAFLVMGFRDILSFVRIPEPKTPLEFQVNVHCVEDTDHWVWYLADLERLGFTWESWGARPTDVFRRLWADESFYVRRIVYLSIHYVQMAKDPLISLVLLEILEAVFAAFVKHIGVPIRREGLFSELEYYGRTHFDKETAHAMGSWTEESAPAVDLVDYELSAGQRRLAREMIDQLFRHFERVFESWYQHRATLHGYRRVGRPLPHRPSVRPPPYADFLKRT